MFMIKTREDLIEYLSRDMAFYYEQSKREQLMCRITHDPIFYIAEYIRLLRMEEYYFNVKKGKIGTIIYLWYFRKKNKLGNKLGFKIPKNTFGPGLTIYHHGEIIINENAQIGANAKLHGGNCIGNNGKNDGAPHIGNDLDLGIGAKIIGGVSLEDNICIGANAVVTKSFEDNNLTLVGIPARLK